eukprot:1617499-Pyramimonas_sp.AAC.1
MRLSGYDSRCRSSAPEEVAEAGLVPRPPRWPGARLRARRHAGRLRNAHAQTHVSATSAPRQRRGGRGANKSRLEGSRGGPGASSSISDSGA